MLKYTEGPYKYENGLVLDKHNRPIANPHFDRRNYGDLPISGAEMDMNGHLLAAAPEMLELLQYWANVVQAGGRLSKMDLTRARALMKKARGSGA